MFDDGVFRPGNHRHRSAPGEFATAFQERAVAGETFQVPNENNILGQIARGEDFRAAAFALQPVERNRGRDGKEFPDSTAARRNK